MTAGVTASAGRGAAGLAFVGDRAGILLAGPPAGTGAEPLSGHRARLGPLPVLGPAEVLAAASDSGLLGRGGGGFPTARKLAAVRAAARRTGRVPVVVVNGSESEPASRKDRTLLELRPHLVLDGAELAATAVGADTVRLHLHRGSVAAIGALRAAVDARAGLDRDAPVVAVSVGPDRYVAGESSAVVAHLSGEPARPRFARRPVAESGLGGRPTLLVNVETAAHLAVLTRLGAGRWRSLGASGWSGPTLVTAQVGGTGSVAEVVGPATVGDLLTAAGGGRQPPPAILVGGYAGRWVPGARLWRTSLDRAALAAAGAPIGCGLLAALPAGACGLAETARITRWLAGESAGQCGPCALGLPALADLVERLAAGRGRGLARRLARLTAAVDGRGACRHPDGVVALVTSAVDTFAADAAAHLAGRPCAGARAAGRVLPVPAPEGGWR